MKNALLLLTCILFLSCKKEKKIVTVTPEKKADTIATIIGKVGTTDENCLWEIEYAKKMIKEKGLTYFVYGNGISYGQHADILKPMLAPYNIKCERISGPGNCIPLINSRPNCSLDYMNAIVKAKFKEGFVDSLEAVAFKIYVKKFKDDTYNDITFNKHIFYPAAKSYETQRQDCQLNFIKGFKYPEKFNLSDSLPAWEANVSLLIQKNGNLKIDDITVDFKDKQNNNFRAYFKDKIKQFILRSEWIPLQVEGYKLNCHAYIKFEDEIKQ
jgi:hypothetical protein